MSETTEVALTIAGLADATRLSAHTIRYYERMGLIPRVSRNAAGHRRYTADHVRWVGLLDRLKVSGMSIRQMRAYVELVMRGSETIEQRCQLLREHEQAIANRIAELDESLQIVRAKLSLYEGTAADPGLVWKLIASARAQRFEARSGIAS